ncbi:Cobalamin biosynthesis protein CbiB [Marinomonas spartinae]|uniref:Cobalamin biosynthesis protein CobD n=1 Tax=Marinomonas spartinae TaxID=1792290 RepID=A0A1A8T6Y3_9GAMM|nr:adenosylcobinamide-phosphate synthase CbiB [Marinomonas spartinae]SBS27085.1 Cobalamin biosynthesis protein CbiB [Marinomonas spartinae]
MMTSFLFSVFDLLASTSGMLVAALLLDRLVGEPKKWHPLVVFGRWVDICRRGLQLSLTDTTTRQRQAGAVAWCCAIFPLLFGLVILMFILPDWLTALLSIIVLYFSIGWQSLREHALAIVEPLIRGDLLQARHGVSRIVSRDTNQLDETQVAKASIESVLENGSDAVFAPIFWFLVLGVPGALLYRLANTLDAMWGYKTDTLLHFGWFAARFDDVMNYIPARLVVLTYGLCGQFGSAWRCYQEQSSSWKSPNAGPVMAAGAGALGIKLGGAAPYFGKLESRSELGEGRDPVATDLNKAIRLVDKGVYLWVLVVCLMM